MHVGGRAGNKPPPAEKAAITAAGQHSEYFCGGGCYIIPHRTNQYLNNRIEQDHRWV
jgi:transposase-like protein